MKNGIKNCIMALMLTFVLLPLTAAEVKADTCKLTIDYDASLATLTMYDNKTKETVNSGDDLTINENGWTDQIAVEFNIADQYRIKSVTINNVDNTDGFVSGGYGKMGKAFNEDTVIKLVVEKAPANLPYVAGAKIYAGGTKASAAPVGDSYRVDEHTFKLWAYPFFADGGAYPEYYAEGYWQFSLDGSTWTDCKEYGWSRRCDFWPGWNYWPENTPINFVTDKNYYLRIQLNGRRYYSQGTAYSDAIFMNSDGTVNRIDIKNPTVLPADASSSGGNDDAEKPASSAGSGGNEAGQSASSAAGGENEAGQSAATAAGGDDNAAPSVTEAASVTAADVVVDLPAVKIVKPKAAKKAAVIKWKKISKKNRKKIGGIEIQYSTDKSFKSGVKTRTAKKTALSKKITRLKSKKKYYVRVRAYKKVNGVKHVSKWSGVRNVKAK